MDPVSEALTTSSRPARTANVAMIISARLPNVALMSAPALGPTCCET
jgi:hypothetical protein